MWGEFVFDLLLAFVYTIYPRPILTQLFHLITTSWIEEVFRVMTHHASLFLVGSQFLW